MTPLQALRELEVAAELISHRPQTVSNVVDAIRVIASQVERWRLLYLWEYLQFDAKAEPNRLIGAHQNASAALCGIARDLKMEPLNRSSWLLWSHLGTARIPDVVRCAARDRQSRHFNDAFVEQAWQVGELMANPSRLSKP